MFTEKLNTARSAPIMWALAENHFNTFFQITIQPSTHNLLGMLRSSVIVFIRNGPCLRTNLMYGPICRIFN